MNPGPVAEAKAKGANAKGAKAKGAKAKTSGVKAKTKAEAKAKVEAKTKSKAKAAPKTAIKPATKPATDAKAKAEPAAEASEETDSAPKGRSVARSDEPKLMPASKLPKPIRALHACAADDVTVEMSHERYGKSVVFFVTCPPERGKLNPIAVYVARDLRGAAAQRVKFEMPPTGEGSAGERDVIYSAVPAREAYTNPGDSVPNAHVRNDPPWIAGAWRPDDLPGVCAVAAHWRINGEKAELWFWEQATECPKDGLPNYQGKVDKNPPPLVMR